MNFTNKGKKKEYIYNDPKYSEEHKISVFTLQRENEILQNKIEQLSEINKNLMEQISQLCEYKLNNQKVIEENEKLKISLENSENILKNLEEKNKNLEFQIKKLNNIINENEGDKINYDAKIEKLLIFKDKFEEIEILYNQLKKENKKLKKNLQLFYQENHLAALKLREYEQKFNIQENNFFNNQNQNSQIINPEKIMEKISSLKKQAEDIGKRKIEQ